MTRNKTYAQITAKLEGCHARYTLDGVVIGNIFVIYRTIGGPLRMARIFSRYSAADYRTYTEVEHDAIMQAILARNVVALCAAMTAHVVRAQARISSSLIVGESRRDS